MLAGARLGTYTFVVLRGVAYNAWILQLCVDQGCGITRLALLYEYLHLICSYTKCIHIVL